MPGTAFGFGPRIRSSGNITGGCLFRNDALQRQLARGQQDSITAGLEVIDVADKCVLIGAQLSEKVAQTILPDRKNIPRDSLFLPPPLLK